MKKIIEHLTNEGIEHKYLMEELDGGTMQTLIIGKKVVMKGSNTQYMMMFLGTGTNKQFATEEEVINEIGTKSLVKPVKEMNFHEKLLRSIVVSVRNDILGGLENAFLDLGEEEFRKTYGYPTKEDIINQIYDEIMNNRGNQLVDDNGYVLEKKHIRFMGTEFVKNLIQDRVDHLIKKEGSYFLK